MPPVVALAVVEASPVVAPSVVGAVPSVVDPPVAVVAPAVVVVPTVEAVVAPVVALEGAPVALCVESPPMLVTPFVPVAAAASVPEDAVVEAAVDALPPKPVVDPTGASLLHAESTYKGAVSKPVARERALVRFRMGPRGLTASSSLAHTRLPYTTVGGSPGRSARSGQIRSEHEAS